MTARGDNNPEGEVPGSQLCSRSKAGAASSAAVVLAGREARPAPLPNGFVQQLAVLISTTREDPGHIFASRRLSIQASASTGR